MADSGRHPHITFQKRWVISETTAFLLGRCEAMIRVITDTPIDPNYRQSLYMVSLRKGARATTAIEGNTLSDEEAERIQRGEHLPPSKGYLETEVKNIMDALAMIRDEVILQQRDSLVTPELFLNFHKMVGQNLGENFEAVPGKFRQSGHNVVVGRYRAPDANEVPQLIETMCRWLRREFNYETGQQTFIDKVVEAIVCHLYIAWIHPFGDGNGRTARLIEYYLLLRAGLPDVASHILSNHYNDTREAYYRHIETATRAMDLTRFIAYAVQGFHDGLTEVLELILANQKKTIWENYIYSVLDAAKVTGKTKAVIERQRALALSLPADRYFFADELMITNVRVVRLYQGLSNVTLKRDMKALIEKGLVKEQKGSYIGNINLLLSRLPAARDQR